ncbi:MAG: hypothetical protein FWG32_09750, partial [Oscillospiraceae bacterium]|nr:hypothetical protein [Oscillospiraceae bacterium]
RAEEMREFIVSGHEAGKTNDSIISELKAKVYTEEYAACQPEGAFLLNTEIMVAMVLRENSASPVNGS